MAQSSQASDSTKKTDFVPMFYPKSIAIIGASKNKVGGVKYFFAQQSSGYIADGGKVYLINPNLKELFGEPVYPSLDDPRIPKPVDLVIISVPAELVPPVVRQLNQKNARFGSIFSSGFIESGNPELDKKLHEAVAQSDTRFIGPNCLGVLSPYAKVMIYPDWVMATGPIAYIAQSGGTMARLCLYLSSIGIGFSNVLSIGNMIDIQPTELLEYFNQDERTTTIALYLESIADGRAFMKKAKEVGQKKPIVLWKGGQSQRGMGATFSHTGGLAGSFQVWKGMARQSGILTASHFEQFMDTVQIATLCRYPPKNLNVAILVAGGGIGVEFTDLLENAGFIVPDLQTKTKKALEDLFPPVNTNFKNPIDLGEYGYDPRLFAKAMSILLGDDSIGSVVYVREPERFKTIGKLMNIQDAQKLTIETLTMVLKDIKKPIICNPSANKDDMESFTSRIEFQKAMIKAGLPVINYIANVPHVLRQLYEYGRFLDAQKKEK